jgi:hypothetical protein
MLQNLLFVFIVKYISTNKKSILLLVIILGIIIIKMWFYKKIIRHKPIIVFLSGYINKGISLT